MQPPTDIQPLCRALADGLRATLGSNLYGVYLYGAVAFADGPTGDIDLHVILRQPPSDEARVAIEQLHARLAQDFPPLGGELDGYYIRLDDARQSAPPPHLLLPGVVDNSWALHCAHIRAGRVIVLYGPDPMLVYPPATWPELVSALHGELDYVREHLNDYPAYCTLNLCRLVYSFEARDVVISKAGAAAWAVGAMPRWQPLIAAAQRAYAHQATAPDEALMRSGVHDLYQFARQRIHQAEEGQPCP